MLKKYIQALLEGFLASKRAWVSSQSIPSKTYINYEAKFNTWVGIIPAFDGWICVDASLEGSLVSMVEIGSSLDRVRTSFQLPSETRFNKLSLPIQKGVSISYKITGSNPKAIVSLHKNIGSQ